MTPVLPTAVVVYADAMTVPTTVVNIALERHTLYIGRARYDRWRGIPLNNPYQGFWGNPFQIGWHGDRDQVIALYEDWLLNAPEANEHRRRLPELRGAILGCHCHLPDRVVPCHGDVLARLTDTLTPFCVLRPRSQLIDGVFPALSAARGR